MSKHEPETIAMDSKTLTASVDKSGNSRTVSEETSDNCLMMTVNVLGISILLVMLFLK